MAFTFSYTGTYHDKQAKTTWKWPIKKPSQKIFLHLQYNIFNSYVSIAPVLWLKVVLQIASPRTWIFS